MFEAISKVVMVIGKILAAVKVLLEFGKVVEDAVTTVKNHVEEVSKNENLFANIFENTEEECKQAEFDFTNTTVGPNIATA